MSNDKDPVVPPPAMESGERSSEPYRVGYRHPPKDWQYKPGQSGNWSGRRKRRTSLQANIIAALDAQMPGGKTFQQDLAEKLVKGACNWNALALKILVPIAVLLDSDKDEGEHELTEQQQKLIEDFNCRKQPANSSPKDSKGDNNETDIS